ncbi:MAG: hypothetical protein BWK73_28460 [Thiothrix lacustris]|uniref:Uncharacterized protein n=1 Tax=Thiothrix lacustris TaxID=525917 RepID=A0A1Y1QJN3_9GAMM|nr:MAG: hypothetical protein BWK73_28460 [Thiothrix lacustris]
MDNQLVSLDQNAVRTEIERQIAQVGTGHYDLAYNQKLFGVLDGITDNQVKGELLQKFLDSLSRHQNVKDLASILELESRIRINERIAESELEKDKIRTALFNNRALILFAWVFPVLAGFISIKFLQSYTFATFIVIVLYGVLIALYFSQSNGLAETWRALTSRRRDL